MSEQQSTNLVHQAYENFKSGDIQAVLDLLSEDVEWQLPEIEGVPFSGKRHGREQVGQFFSTLAEAQEVREFEPREFVAEGEKVVALGHYAWYVKATEREFESDFAHVFSVDEGRIASFKEYTDTAAATAAYRRD